MTSSGSLDALVRDLRAGRRLTQGQLAAAAGISERAVSDIERGLRSRVYPATAAALADALELEGDARRGFLAAAQAGRGSGQQTSAAAQDGSSGWRALRRDPMVGRTGEVSGLVAALQAGTHRLHTITGPGGVGKSRLAAEVCAQFDPWQVRWVSLSEADGPQQVRAALAGAVGLPADAGLPSLAVALEDAVSVLVLDTFERVLPAAGLVAELLDRTTRCRTVVTSRAPLRIRGEQLLPLQPLDERDAVALFCDRARAVAPRICLDDAESVASVSEIAHRLSGLPLAIELAAAKLRHVPLATLRRLLVRPLDVLSEGPRDLPPRQHAMRSTIRWSYELLSDTERRTFWRLGQFAGLWDLQMAEAVTGEAQHTLTRLGALCDYGLIQPDPHASARLDAPAWRMLDPIRDFAVEHLLASGEAAAVGSKHAQLMVEVAEAAAVELLGVEQASSRTRLQLLVPNLRSAFRWACEVGDAEAALRIAGGLWMFWRMAGRFTEGRQALAEALELNGAAESVHRPAALWGAGWLAYHQNDQQAAATYAAELLRLATSTGDPLQRRNALTLLGNVALARREFGRAVGMLGEALTLATAEGAGWHTAASLLNLGTALLHAGDPKEAVRLLDDATRAFELVGDRHFVARCGLELGYAALVADDPSGARTRFADALAQFLELAEQWGCAEAILGFATVAAVRGDAETAAFLSGATERTYADIAVQLNAPDAALVSGLLEGARDALGAGEWAVAVADGRGVPIEDAAAIALDRVPG